MRNTVKPPKGFLVNGKIKVGDLYMDCGCHPVKCTLSDGDDIEGTSLADGSAPRMCSKYNCGPIKITKKKAQEFVEAFKKDGEKGLMRIAGYSDENIEYFFKNYRQQIS